MSLLLRWRRYVRGIVIQVAVSFEQLLLPERLEAMVALIGLLIRVYQHVTLQVTRRNRGVRAKVTLVALFALVGLAVQLVAVPVGERLAATFAL